jgi:hypothetical protein
MQLTNHPIQGGATTLGGLLPLEGNKDKERDG